ncbi:Protein of unknown function DUF58 [Paenibacillus algorifonticola]|uniref:Uncharacterized protein n=2 Tax=Paenibacillus algorifonticola TaxID=684063 RepID=A0A1I2BRV5_9BACL|nr:Protein of unknown function DUF58 [Paenibacillus algorifonticola]
MLVVSFIIAAIIIVMLQANVFRRFALRNISYSRRFSQKTCFSGDRMELVEQLSNGKWLPVPWLRVESQLSSQLIFRSQDNLAVSSGEHYQNHKSFFSLMPYTKITRTHSFVSARRGVYKLRSVALTGGDLLGIQHDMKQIMIEGELLVYPLPAQVPNDELPSHSWQGETSVRRWIVEDPFVVVGARDYRPSDSFKAVNWKATARAGKLQVHQYDYTADRKLMIYLNVEDHEGMWRTITDEALIERGIEWAAGAAEAVTASGMEVGFAANMPLQGELESAMLLPRSGYDQWLAILELLAKLSLTRTELFSDLLQRESERGVSGCDLLIISAYWNETLELAAQQLRFGGNSVSIWLLAGQASEQQQAGGVS